MSTARKEEPTTLEVTADAPANIPLQELQPSKTGQDHQDNEEASSHTAQPVEPTPDLPPIDKRGFLTLLFQHVSR